MAEQTPGARIVREHLPDSMVGWRERRHELAAAIDAAIAAAREEEKQYGRDFTEENNAEWQKIVDAKKEQLAAKDAEAAAMRLALQEIRDWRGLDPAFHMREYAIAALSSTAGADLLARLQRAEMKLAQREEFITNGQVEIIEYVNASVQAQAASQKALLARLRAAEQRADDMLVAMNAASDFSAKAIQQLTEEKRAAEEKAALFDSVVGHIQQRMRDLEIKGVPRESVSVVIWSARAAELEELMRLIASLSAEYALAAIQAARAKEPVDG